MRARSSSILIAGLAALAACSDAPTAVPSGEEVVFAIASDASTLGRATSRGAGQIAFTFGPEVIDNYRFTAVRRANGTVGGIFEFRHRYSGLTVRASGDVVCLATDGNHIRMGGIVKETNFEEGVPTHSFLTWSVTDNGRRDQGHIDSASSFLGVEDAELYCREGLPYPEYPLAEGDIHVRRR